ncbi:MAG TPA: hypothetical protein VKH81_11155 [Candidatus Angelobacter sp.]|nr:hypothetical protein [Candidatus Angelobacter sp.]
MAHTTHILSVGYDATLMPLRSMLLRGTGYVVEESYSIAKAFLRAQSDAIDLLLICHTVPENDQKKLIAFVRSVRKLLPILCITNQEFAYSADGCLSVTNSPVELLEAVISAANRAPECRI